MTDILKNIIYSSKFIYDMFLLLLLPLLLLFLLLFLLNPESYVC
jgi:hypothetical protein